LFWPHGFICDVDSSDFRRYCLTFPALQFP
jgi:hypothetical protein